MPHRVRGKGKYYVYVVRCADETLYAGIAKNVQQRVVEHNTAKRGAKYTRTRRPVVLVYTKAYQTRGLALKAEYRFKQLSRKEKLIHVTMAKNKPIKKEPEILSFKTANVFLTWFKKHYTREEGIWLHLFKKDSGVTSITRKEALDVALCYGWIDGQAKKYDDVSWLQKYTPRRTKSMWSKINRDHIARLTKEGKMHAAGIAAVEAAKKDGRWDQAYSAPSMAIVPDYFLKELKKNKKAFGFFDTLNKTNRYAIVWRLETAKKEETRERRIKAIITMLEEGKKFH